MTKREVILAALAPAKGAAHTPVQVQKLLFLIDKEASHLVGGPFFDFTPYNYGPFDKRVYKEIEALAGEGLAVVNEEGNARSFGLTPTGQSIGDTLLNTLHPNAQKYIREVSEFVRRLSFSALVSAIYKRYPEMRVNSVFR